MGLSLTKYYNGSEKILIKGAKRKLIHNGELLNVSTKY
jgi:hypothetical protein